MKAMVGVCIIAIIVFVGVAQILIVLGKKK